MNPPVVSFQQISRILDVTDALGVHREWVEIPLSPERPGVVRRLPNGKLEIVVDADQPIRAVADNAPDANSPGSELLIQNS
jgi:hypothetical protein